MGRKRAGYLSSWRQSLVSSEGDEGADGKAGAVGVSVKQIVFEVVSEEVEVVEGA